MCLLKGLTKADKSWLLSISGLRITQNLGPNSDLTLVLIGEIPC